MADRVPRLRLVHAFAALFAAVALALGLLGWSARRDARQTILDNAETLRATAARRAAGYLQRTQRRVESAVQAIERQAQLGVIQPADPVQMEAAVLAALAENQDLSELAFTFARRTGFDEEGAPRLAQDAARWQVAAFRPQTGTIRTRRTEPAPGGGFEAREREVSAEGPPALSPFVARMEATDPTTHATFRTTASEEFDGESLWSDLHWWEQDAQKPPAERRVIVSLQRSLASKEGEFWGVVRAGLFASVLDEVATLQVDDSDPNDPHLVFLADAQGRLVTRLAPGDPRVLVGDDLRVRPAVLPEPVDRALHGPLLAAAASGEEASGEVRVRGEDRWLVTFRALAGTQGWLVGVAVPEDYYTGPLRELQSHFLFAGLLLLVLLGAGGAAMLVTLQGGLQSITVAAGRMRALDFAKGTGGARFRDIHEVLDGLERAKTALRTMGRYVPVDLVRKLYRENKEPEPGGELRELTLLFTDVAGFTALSERLAPDELARALGRYFEALTRGIAGSGGTVDKFIGDAVMALWNAPERRDGHAHLACGAVLACQEETARLFASREWAGLPPLTTRYGLHTGEALVGHFGTPERLAYTALGDHVNLAARLEGLCKQYGVTVLVSEAVEERARGAFQFRMVDVVAVKGKTQGVRVFELLGRAGEAAPKARAYQEAFGLYQKQRFAEAQLLLEGQLDDGPSQALHARCEAYRAAPPGAGWDGIHRPREK